MMKPISTLSNASLAAMMAGIAILLAVLLAGHPAAAQPMQANRLATATTTPPPAETTVKELEALAATLEDEAKRKELLAGIHALIAVKKSKREKEKTESSGARLIAILSDKARDTGRMVGVAVRSLGDFPALVDWFTEQATKEKSRRRWLWLFLKLAVVLAAGIMAEKISATLLAKPRRAVEGREADTALTRIAFLSARTVLDLVPVAVFFAAAYAVLPLARPDNETRILALSFINAYLITRVVLAAARMALVPAVPRLRLAPVTDETANYLFIWSRRFIAVAVFGFFIAEAGLLLGLPKSGYQGVLHVSGLLLTGMATAFILQNRIAVANWVRRAGGEGFERAGMRGLRERFADIWHVLAILYVAGIYGVWALGVEDGFEFMLRATVLSVVILIAARLIALGVRRAVDRGFAIGDEVKARYPELEERANRYVPVVHLSLRWAVYILAALALLQAWGVDSFGWLDTPIGRNIIQSSVSIAAVIVVSLIVWESINSTIERYLSKMEEDDKSKRAARARTLLPLLRNVVFVVLGVMVTLIVLSELGVNIGPLLAGAGVLGLAIGFGSQKLVQDLITGAFILFEDTMQVGDVVKVGDKAGVVEALSIRSLRLRDYAGDVHTLPFSTVETVTNMTKEFAFASFKVGVAYREDTDEVTAVMEEVGADMQADEKFGKMILEPIDIAGVDEFADSAVVIKGRFKTKPQKHWQVKREFFRRLKKRFDELGIEIPFPHRTVYFGIGKDGDAPPARVHAEEEDRWHKARKRKKKGGKGEDVSETSTKRGPAGDAGENSGSEY